MRDYFASFRNSCYRPAMPFGNRKTYFRWSFQFSIVTINAYHFSGNLKMNYLDNFESLLLRFSMAKILSISPKLNFTPYTLGCYGLISKDNSDNN